MTTLNRPPVYDNVLQFDDNAGQFEPPPTPRKRRLIPSSRPAKVAVAAGATIFLVAGFLGVVHQTPPGGALWGVEKALFADHAQDVALTAVVADLKKAQDILDSGQQPTPDQLSDARTALNAAKQNLDNVTESSERTSLQNLYLQLTQQLLQYTPESAQQLPPLPAPETADLVAPVDPQGSTDLAWSPTEDAPTWGYSAPIEQQSATVGDFIPLPPGVPDAPLPDWPQPYAPPLTPNLGYLGYYDPSWGQLYGYDRNDWYNYDLGGYNQYGYDFLGFDRWGYDRWGYDRWGYDRWGYNWAGYNWAGYDRHGWDRDGYNEWGQHRNRPGDPRRQDWYDRHHPFIQYYDWKFRNHNPVFRRTLWDQAHHFRRDLYRDWNRNRDWHNPRKRDWAPPAVTNINIHISTPVVNLHASLTQFIGHDKADRRLIKDLADKSPRNFARELKPRLPGVRTQQRPEVPSVIQADHRQKRSTPPELTERAPKAPPSKVAPGFAPPKVAPVPPFTPKDEHPRQKPNRIPDNVTPGSKPDRSQRPEVVPPDARDPKDSRNDAPRRPEAPRQHEIPADEPKPASPPNSDRQPSREAPAPGRTDREPQRPPSEPPAHQDVPKRQEPPQRQSAPEPPVRREDAPRAPRERSPEPPARQAPVQQQAPRERPERQAPPPREAPRERAPQQAPRQREAPQRAERPAPQQREAPAPRQRQERAPKQRQEHGPRNSPKCTLPMC